MTDQTIRTATRRGKVRTNRGPRLNRLRWLLLLVCCTCSVENVLGAAALEPVYWKERLFYVPYRVSQTSRALDPVRKVQLLISSDGVSNWKVLQQAEPNVQGFTYNAPADGEYWFALRHLDRRGNPWPSPTINPQMRIVIDTAPPQLTLNAALDANGAVSVRYEASDVSLHAPSLHLEVRPEGGSWTSLPATSHDVSHPDRLVGRVRWNAPANARMVEVRGSIADRTGLRGAANAELGLSGPAMSRPSGANIAQNSTRSTVDPFKIEVIESQGATPASREWPQAGMQASLPPANSLSASDVPPPTLNPYCADPYRNDEEEFGSTTQSGRTTQGKTPARLIGDLSPKNKPLVIELPDDFAPTPLPPISKLDKGWQAPSATQVTSIRSVNSRTFEIEYDLETIGPWGVSKVELWGTHDDGNTWQSYGVDDDNRSPLRVSVPGSGTYGFRIVVQGAGTAVTPPPRNGDKPELNVEVDLQTPTAEIVSVEPGRDDLTGHLQIRWAATDSNLERRPISLFYGSYAEGPWSAIATQLPNTGSYTWRMERHLPDRFYIRLESRDIAGNVAAAQTDTPFEIKRPQPTGTLRGVRPVDNVNGLYETADSSAR